MRRIWTVYTIRRLTEAELALVGDVGLTCACGQTPTHDATYRYVQGEQVQQGGYKQCASCARANGGK